MAKKGRTVGLSPMSAFEKDKKVEEEGSLLPTGGCF